ncbi:sensor domain-containing diguanylate cyclase [Robertmurraya sp. DFI.2.37]|uniref:sensor domain-containing diguanylate cyclase n=1 Tax=Robertmurraya sp. DFI.2.37 TaxID=3031819 RepID=UPI0023DC2584|nr:sensor domain-containing diguanylate cyclase [Robertmurraya sp. DFI.2.37]MDF1510072.1 sensor domain-containing diguanylate cyclase [Robertmurraya sp. DFI.2.37]
MNRSNVVKITAILLFTIVLLAHNYILVNSLQAITVMIILVGAISIWSFAHLYQKTSKKAALYELTKKELETINEERRLIEVALDTVNDIAVFSYSTETGDFYISKGIEHIYGYPYREIREDLNLWKLIVHPEDIEEIERKIGQLTTGTATSTELRIIRPDGEMRWIIYRGTPIKNNFGHVISITGEIIDITERKMLEMKLKQLAFFDELTDLANRTLLERHLKKALSRSRRLSHPLAVMFIDLDGFKKVNDTMGHETGDLLLKEVAIRLKNSVRDEDFIARLGGDEFIILFEETKREDIQDIAQRVLTNVSFPYLLGDKQPKVTPSIGIAMYPEDGEDEETLLNNADKAMYYAKSKGKNNIQFYMEEIRDLPVKKKGVLKKIFQQLQTNFSK